MKKKLLISWFPFPPIPNCKGFLNLTHTQIYRTFWDLYLLQGHYKISTLPTISRGPIHEKVEDMHTIIRYTCDTRATCKIENWVKMDEMKTTCACTLFSEFRFDIDTLYF